MEDLLKGSESVGRGSSGSNADLFVDNQRLQMRAHSEDDRALLWNMVDAMKADWQRSSNTRNGGWPANNPASASRVDDAGGRGAETSSAGDFLRSLPAGIAWPFASWTNHGLICTMCTRPDGGSDVEYCGARGCNVVETTGQGAVEEEAFQQTEGTRLDELEASQDSSTLPYRTPRNQMPSPSQRGLVR